MRNGDEVRRSTRKEVRNNKNIPYKATIVPLTDGFTFASLIESFKSAMNVSTIETVSRYQHPKTTIQKKASERAIDDPRSSSSE